jgi:hypothetical protein
MWPNPNPCHSAVPFPGRPFVLITDEVYGTFTDPAFGCPWGWVHTLQVAQPRMPRVMGEYKIAENSCPAPTRADQEWASYASHNPTLTRNLALIMWHSGGLQAIDISSPTRMKQENGSRRPRLLRSPTRIPPSAWERTRLSCGASRSSRTG